MLDLQAQMRAYIEATIERVDAEDLIARGAGIRVAAELRTRRRRVLIAVGAAIATLVLAGGAALLALWLTSDEAPVATTLAPTTLATTSTTAAATLPELDPSVAAAWGAAELVPLEETIPPFGGGGHIVNDIAASDTLVVAVGDAMSGDENAMRDGLVWISADGRTWERALDPDDLDFGGRGLSTVVVSGPRFVVGGTACDTEERCTAGWRAALWTSTDGRDWQRVPHDTILFGERSAITQLVSYRGRILALGFVCDGPACQSAIWASPDGLTWERIWSGESTWPNAIAVSATGLVAVGSVGTDTGSHAAVWISVDGTEWDPIPHDPEVFGDGMGTDTSMSAVAAGGGGYVAIGSDGTGAVIWFSADAFTWERLPDPTRSLADASVYRVFAWGEGFLGVGPDWAVTEEMGGPVPGWPSIPSRPTVWVSPDGRTWYSVGIGEPDAVAAVRSLAAFGDMLIVVGQQGTFLQGQDAIWVNEQPPALDP